MANEEGPDDRYRAGGIVHAKALAVLKKDKANSVFGPGGYEGLWLNGTFIKVQQKQLKNGNEYT